jgi:hypothetical protein
LQAARKTVQTSSRPAAANRFFFMMIVFMGLMVRHIDSDRG